MAPCGIAVVLPPRESISPTDAGAVALTVRDDYAHSAYRDSITVVGSPAPAAAGIAYHALGYRPRDLPSFPLSLCQRSSYRFAEAFVAGQQISLAEAFATLLVPTQVAGTLAAS